MNGSTLNLGEENMTTENLNTTRPRRKNSHVRHRTSLQDRIHNGILGQNIPLQNMIYDHNADQAEALFENHVNRIISKMEEDPDMMENNMESEKLRRDALKQMPQCLTVKRTIKRKLTKSINVKPRGHPIGFFKRMHYSTSIQYSKLMTHIANLSYTFELWYGSLKTIEGHFGSATSSYFKFLRWLFLLNISVMIVTIPFIIIPQITFREIMDLLDSMRTFQVWDLFTGEGSLTNTLLYYGYYSNQTENFYGFSYNMPLAYFCTMLFIYLVSFLVLGYSVAVSYRKSFIETEGILKNKFAHKIFSGWDFSIATREGASLKSSAIYYQLKELISELQIKNDDTTLLKNFKAILVKVMANIVILTGLCLIGYSLWMLLLLYSQGGIGPIIIAIIANFLNITVPMLFTKIASYENYENPRNAVGITLIRSFLLSVVIVGTLVTFWLMNSSTRVCWETLLGQEMYRLILFDFLLSLMIHCAHILYYLMINRFYDDISTHYEFDVASNTLDLIYSQSLFWVGFYFSPLLSVTVSIKIFLTWYLKKYFVLKVCKPSMKPWRASQTQTWFLSLTFLTLLATGGLMAFILLKMPPTSCGPFQDYKYFYEVILVGVNQNTLPPFKYIDYLTKPGVVSLIIIALCARVYYVKETANAQRDMVQILRNMLVWQSKDREFLLEYISKVSNGEWKYSKQDCRYQDPYVTVPDINQSRHTSVGDTAISTSNDNFLISSDVGAL